MIENIEQDAEGGNGALQPPEDDNNCSGCLNILDGDEIIHALGQKWHMDCFRCSACDAALSSWYFEKDGLLFCKDDYYAKYGESCQQCSQVITGPVMVAGEHKFHPECFCCVSCSLFIGDGDSYALVERSKLYCGQCYKRQMQPLQRLSQFPFVGRKPHSIRLVEVAGGQKGIKLCEDVFNTPNNTCFTISELDMNQDLMSLHIGDKILEINGTPVKDTPLENVENLLRYSDTLIQLTIEHDPETLSRHIRPLPSLPLTTTASDTNIPTKAPEIPEISKHERLFRKKDEGYMSASRSRQLRRKNQTGDSKNLDKERSSSLSRLLDESPNTKHCQELSRACSFLDSKPQQRVFRASDLVKGELLGQGFFGQVFKVTTRDTEEVMVLKELYRVDEEAQKNFLKEVAVLRNLHHNNVLRFIGVLYKERRLHLVTEYISGGSLAELLHDTIEPLPWEQRISFAKDIAAGMAYLHSRNIIHRDLNSHNCLVREDKTVIVADFGLARIVSQGTDHGRRLNTGNGKIMRTRQERKKRYTVVGNPYWMAPEMMKGNKYDEKVDIFSFGIVLCEIIGRVQADPDFLPRSNDFGLNQTTFKEKFCLNCPEPFYRVAFLCTDLNPDKRPPFEVMEVWLESLSMHLSVGMTLPPDLIFDIEHYRGVVSPPASGTVTPEMTCTPLEPICEGKVLTKPYKSKSTDNITSAENLHLRKELPIIKVASCSEITKQKPLTKKLKSFPNYENIDFLKNDTDFIKTKPVKPATVKSDILNNCQTPDTSNLTKFNVNLRKVPKNFTRNRFQINEPQNFKKCNNVSLQNMKIDNCAPSTVNQKYFKTPKEIVASTLNVLKSPESPNFSKLFRRSVKNSDSSPETHFSRRQRFTKDALLPVDPTPSSGSVVRTIVDTLNRRDRFLNRGANFGRNSLKVSGNPKICKHNIPRSASPDEFTPL